MSRKHWESLISKLDSFKRNLSSREEIPGEQNLVENLTKNFTFRRVSWRDSWQDRAKILAAGNCASWRESWRDSWQDRSEILAAGTFASQRESWRDSRQDRAEISATGNFASRQDQKSRRPKSRRDPGGISAKIAAGSRQDPGPYFTRALTGQVQATGIANSDDIQALQLIIH